MRKLAFVYRVVILADPHAVSMGHVVNDLSFVDSAACSSPIPLRIRSLNNLIVLCKALHHEFPAAFPQGLDLIVARILYVLGRSGLDELVELGACIFKSNSCGFLIHVIIEFLEFLMVLMKLRFGSQDACTIFMKVYELLSVSVKVEIAEVEFLRDVVLLAHEVIVLAF